MSKTYLDDDEGVVDHPYINEDRGIISLLETIEEEHPTIEKKAFVQIVREPRDIHMWERRRGAMQLGLPESELATEPDEMPDHSDDQGWEPEEEEYV